MTGKTLIKLIVSLVICQAAGGVGAIFTSSAIREWYSHIQKPSFTPPNWLFGPVWTVLYILMGISLFLVWNVDDLSGIRKKALMAFAVHLGLNVAWSFCFFYLRNPLAGLLEIIALWLSIGIFMILFYQVRPAAMYLQIPYLLWTTFAAALNYSLWRLNPGA